MDDRARIRLLEEENERLRDRIEWLERNLLGSDVPLPVQWSLTPKEGAVIRALARRGEMTKEQLMTALYSDRTDMEEPETKIIDVFVCKLRKKLEPFGIEITTLWGRGYALDAGTRQLLAGSKEAATP